MIAAAWLLAAQAYAAPPVEPAVKLLLRVLSYDTALTTRTHDALVVGVVFDPTDPLSAAQGADVLSSLKGLGGLTVGGIPLGDAQPVPITANGSGPPLETRLASVSALVVCRVPGPLTALSAAADALDRPTLGLDAERVGSGVSVAVGQRQAHLEIVVALGRARAEGMELSPELLEVARVTP